MNRLASSPVLTSCTSTKGPNVHDHITLPLSVWLTATWIHLRDGAADAWERIADDRGADESTARLLWIVAGVAIAIAATGVAVTVFNNASNQVDQSPVAPTP